MFGLKIVTEYERLVVFSIAGRYKGVRGPGLVFVNPFTEKAVARLDLRELSRDVPDQHCITGDSVPVTLDPIVFYKITDPGKTVMTIKDAEAGIMDLTRTTLRAVVGDMMLSDVIAKREQIAQHLKARLAEEAERWGIDITTVEIADLKLQPEVERAMATRKADVEDAEAKRKAAILKAEGEKEAANSERDAALTRAEAEKRAAILKAEGEKEAQILHAEGITAYYKKLIELGEDAEIALKFENIASLRKFAESESTKMVVLPLEAVTGSLKGSFGLRYMEDMLSKKEESK